MAARMVVEATDGFEVAGESETGEDSVVQAKELKPDLVLMDVNLPGINGLDATRQILTDSGDRVVILLLSTYEEEEYAPRAAECGAAAYIPKAELIDRRQSRSVAGTRPTIVVPLPRALLTSKVPPIESIRSAMPWSPVP
jgi:two-component system invasion response regulator UvrY